MSASVSGWASGSASAAAWTLFLSHRVQVIPILFGFLHMISVVRGVRLRALTDANSVPT